MVKLSSQTLDILKNFATINSNLVVAEGSTLATISEAKNILASATVDETFGSAFGIYDLNEFISVVNLVGDPELDIGDETVKLSDGSAKANYRFADASILTTPTKVIIMPSVEVSIDISQEVLQQVKKAAGVLGHAIVSVVGKGGVVELSVLDPKNATANTFSIVLDEQNDCTETFDLQFLISNIKVLSGSYKVSISSKLISKWTHATAAVEYFIALEKTSTFGS